MAPPLKAPGKNGSATDRELVQALEHALTAVGDGYWRAQTAMRAATPVTVMLGEEAGRAMRAHVGDLEPWHAELLAGVAWGQALRGESEGARRTLAELAPLAKKARGEVGTRVECVVARVHHALGDLAACDAALARAERFARGEKENPTQPWPILALARAQCGRLEGLLAQLAPKAQDESLSFDDERAARLAVAQITAAGDATAFARWYEALRERNSYVVYHGLVTGAPRALAAGRPDALHDIAAAYARDDSYGAEAGAEVVRAMMRAGQVALARRTLAAVQAANPHPRVAVAYAWEDLGDAKASAVVQAHAIDARGERPTLEMTTFGEVVQAVHARDPAAAASLLTRGEARALSSQGIDAASAWAALSEAAIAVSDPRAEEWIADALRAVEAAPRGDYRRRSVVETFATRLADRDRWEPALALLRKSTSKYEKQTMAKSLARLWLRAGDVAGALRVLEMGKYERHALAMRLCDLLHARVGLERPFENYV